MKKLIIFSTLITSSLAYASTIQGTLMLKGSVKSKITVKTVPTTCKLKIEEVKNLLEEDDFGNPAYKVEATISLDGNDFERGLRVKMKENHILTNLFTEGKKRIVRDFDYADATGRVLFKIDENGRLTEGSFLHGGEKIVCRF